MSYSENPWKPEVLKVPTAATAPAGKTLLEMQIFEPCLRTIYLETREGRAHGKKGLVGGPEDQGPTDGKVGPTGV